MVIAYDTLNARIDLLEIQIQSLLSSKHKKNVSGFNIFAKFFRHHVRSSLFQIYFQNTGNSHFIPKNTHIQKELAAMWNDISYDEKLHWKNSALI